MQGVDNETFYQVWQNDPYNDNDRDFYTSGPENAVLIDPFYLKLSDCDDENSDLFAPATNVDTKETCP